MIIRKYKESDREQLKDISVICIDGMSVDQNIEGLYGHIAGKDWRYRKQCQIETDIDTNAKGIFVAEINRSVIGFISTRLNRATKVGWISNFCVLPENQRKGIGKKLFDRAIAYFESEGMECVRIETLDYNDICLHFYPKLGLKEVARQVNFAMPIPRR